MDKTGGDVHADDVVVVTVESALKWSVFASNGNPCVRGKVDFGVGEI